MIKTFAARTVLAALPAIILLAPLGAGGCDKPADKTGPAAMQAECLPCGGHSFDVAADTPKSTHDGKTYYFCAPDCKTDFDKDPAKYVKK